MSLRLALVFVLVLSFGSEAAARTVYVNDMLRVGVRTEPNSSLSPIAVVTTGDALEVLDSRGGYIKVRTSEGVEGWINDAYASDEIPARRRIDDLEAERDRLEEQLRELEAASASVREENEALTLQVDDLLDENGTLHARLGKQYASSMKQTGFNWAVIAGGMVGLLLLGFFLGVRWYRRRVAAQHGGLTL